MPLLTRAIAVGFCGTFTTFSSWVVDVVNKTSAAGAFAELISGLTMPFVFCVLGRDAGRLVHGWLAALVRRVEGAAAPAEGRPGPDGDILKARHKRLYVTVDYVFLVASVCAALAVPVALQVRMGQQRIPSITPTYMKAVVVAPAGTVVRFLLSYFLNKRAQWRQFPLGTLLANVVASFLDAFMDNYAAHRPWNEWYWIVENGICAALSTKSSYVNEINNFYAEGRLWMAYAYAVVTLALTVATLAIGRRANFD
ncbi:CrcB-like protein [Strigomonas culicis]|nr:CrcB-like protein [Strigomonas culicis]EPY34752.1 CrcB-like protein [Strigomonas culicis]|eukprot:EPY27867.1 CrcB-like protein [Strigomonas culicis]